MFKVVSVANSAFSVAATGGVSGVKGAYDLGKGIYDLGKGIYDLASSLHDATQGEEERREHLLKKMGKYFTEKQRRVIEREREGGQERRAEAREPRQGSL